MSANQSNLLYDIPINESNANNVGSIYPSTSDESHMSTTSKSSYINSHMINNTHDTDTSWSLSSVGSPGMTSSPKPKQTKKDRNSSLRILVINFQSIRKKGANNGALIETTKPDILIGNETWLTQNFPPAL